MIVKFVAFRGTLKPPFAGFGNNPHIPPNVPIRRPDQGYDVLDDSEEEDENDDESDGDNDGGGDDSGTPRDDNTDLTDDEVCCICQEVIESDHVYTGCYHVFHGQCLSQWVQVQYHSNPYRCPRCPLCNCDMYENWAL